MHYYKFNIKDWSRDTAHLSVEEEGVYRRLIDLYYESEMPIPKETQMVIRRLRLAGHEESVGIILEEFFQLTDEGYRHLRCDDEIGKYHAKAVANRKNGGAGGRPKKPTENPVGYQTEPSRNLNHKPLTTNQEPTKKPSPSAKAEEDGSFEVFWKLYPKKVSRKDAARAWSKIPKARHQQVMEGLAKHRACDQWVKDNGNFIPNAATWLNAERWEDEVKPYVQRAEGNRTVSAVDRVKSRAAERERIRQGAVTQHAEQGDFIEGEFFSR